MGRTLDMAFQSDQAPSALRVTIYDVNGRKLAAPAVQGTGPDYSASWDGRTDAGRQAPPGIYVYEIKAGAAAYRGAAVLAR